MRNGVSLMRFWHAWAAGLLIVSATSLASAQGDPLEEAERAYLDVDFERSLERADAALQAGGRSPQQLARIYELIGITAASLGDEERSRQAYAKMIALRPDAEVDRSLAPRLRAPFQEAQGFWTAQSSRLAAEVSFVQRRNVLRVAMTDPLSMAQTVVMFIRPAGASEFRSERQPAAAALNFETGSSGAPVDYYAHVLDRHGNRIVEIGSEDDPRTAGEAAATPSPSTAGAGLDGGAIAAIVIVVALVAAGLAVGGYFLFADQARDVRAIAVFP